MAENENSPNASEQNAQGLAAEAQGTESQGAQGLRPHRAASRRDFLAGAGTAGVAAAVAVLTTRALGGTRSIAAAASVPREAVYPGRVLLTSAASKPTNGEWAALRNKISTHRLYRPDQSGYTAAKQLFEPRFDSLEPAGIAYCRTAADVGACLSFVQLYGLPVRVRSGGHSYAGWCSVTGGLVIDVSAMKSVEFGKRNVTVGTGLDLIHFYDHLASTGRAVPGGSCPTVGIAGLALGGGIGVLSRLHGLTSDHLESAQLVLADGSVVTCDSSHDSDLLWACQGGGGGNFGVATSFTFRTQALRRIWLFFLGWPWSSADKVMHGWQEWAPHAPNALWSNLHASAAFSGGSPSISVGGTYVGTASGLSALLGDLYHSVGSNPSSVFSREQSYRSAMLVEAGCSTIPINACHTGAGGQLPRVPSYAKSDFFHKPLDTAAISTMLSGIEKIPGIEGTSGGAGTIALDACGGAMNSVRPRDTAFCHRDALYVAQYSTVWTSPGASGGVANQHAWLRSYYNSMHPHANGQAYQNYIDPELKDWETAYYGENYPRLTRIKARYDPDNLFTFPQSIKPA
jgi:FAD/FMN-containing dehydrogenase